MKPLSSWMAEAKPAESDPATYNESLLDGVISFFGSRMPDDALEKIIARIVGNEQIMDRIISTIFSSKKLLSKVMDEMEKKILKND